MTSSSVVCRAEGTEGTSTSPSPEPVKPELERLAKLLRVNAYVELVGGAAVFANPSAVFPGLNAAGIEASQWYALTLGCVALASFLASKLDVHDERTARVSGGARRGRDDGVPPRHIRVPGAKGGDDGRGAGGRRSALRPRRVNDSLRRRRRVRTAPA